MKPSERIQLIKAVASSLLRSSYDVITLTFRQFEIAYEETTRSVTEWWLIDAIEALADDKLIALAEHCGIAALPAAPDEGSGHWSPGLFRLFLSHLASDKVFMAALQHHLRALRVSGFVAHVDIEPTTEWEREIARALNSADALTALLTADFHLSKWTDHEVGIAVGRGLLIVPIRAGLDPYGFIGKYQALNGAGKKANEIAGELADILAKHALTREKYAEVVVSAFEESWSWEACRADMALLERFPYLTESHVARLAAAVTKNEKVATSYGVPDRIARVANRMRAAG